MTACMLFGKPPSMHWVRRLHGVGVSQIIHYTALCSSCDKNILTLVSRDSWAWNINITLKKFGIEDLLLWQQLLRDNPRCSNWGQSWPITGRQAEHVSWVEEGMCLRQLEFTWRVAPWPDSERRSGATSPYRMLGVWWEPAVFNSCWNSCEPAAVTAG